MKGIEVINKCLFHLPVSVPFSILIIRYRVQVGEGDDVAAVRTQPLLIEATLSVLQLALVLVGDANVCVVFHANPGHGRVVALQELMVYPLIMLHRQTHITVKFWSTCIFQYRSNDGTTQCVSATVLNRGSVV